MIVSTAGSGKTLVLTHRVIRIAKDLVADQQLGSRLLCVCYNRNAADEMRDRIATLLHLQNLTERVFVTRDSSTMPNVVTIEVRTFHALGFYILKSSYIDQRACINFDNRRICALTGSSLKTQFFHALQRGGYIPGSAVESGKRKQISELLKALAQEKGVLFDKRCGELLKRGTLDNSFQHPRGEYQIYEEMLSENNAVDYSDMVRKTVMLLHSSKKTIKRLQKRYRAVLVDEFQDMSASQVYICKCLVEESKSLTLVGDDDQQIYSFRTGLGWCCHDVLATVFASIDTLTLNENHRCTGAVTNAAYALINHNTNRVSKEIKAVRDIGEPIQVVSCASQRLEVDFVVKKVRRLLPEARKAGQRIILLFRRNNLLNQFQKRFAQEKIQTTRKATPPQKTHRIGSLTLRVYALFSVFSPCVTEKDFIWAATAVSPCIEGSLLQEILEHQDSEFDASAASCPEDFQAKTEGGRIKSASELYTISPLLNKVQHWYREHQGSSDEEEQFSAAILHTLLSITDALNLKLMTTNRLEDLVQYALSLLSSSSGGSETMLSSQNAINNEAEAHVSNYGTEDPDEGAIDAAAFDILVSAAKRLDDKSVSRRQYVEQKKQKNDAESRSKDSDEEDFAEMFSRDRDLRATKKRKVTGINPIANDKQEPLVDRQLRREQIEKLCVIAEENLKKFGKEWLQKGTSYEAITVLSTAHGAKGCTFPYVFLCGADSNAFPVGGQRSMIADSLFSMWGSDASLGCTKDSNDSFVQEERRLFFVALTRTVTQFICTYASTGHGCDQNTSQSPFIREMLEGLQWDPKYITESFITCEDDIAKHMTSFSRSKQEVKVLQTEPNKPLKQEIQLDSTS